MRRDFKDILIGYVATLPNSLCREYYYLLKDEAVPKEERLTFGKVTLSPDQYNKLVWMWGKDKTDSCISILNEWIAKKNITKPISCYQNLIGWVERAYYRTHPPTDKSFKFISEIDTEWKARKYVMSIPKELRAYDSEVKLLVERFGIKVL